MRCLLIAVALALGIPPCISAQPVSPAEFIAAYRTALQEKSLPKLDALTYMVGLSPSDLKQMNSDLKMSIPNGEVGDIVLRPLPKIFNPVTLRRGKKWEWNYPPIGQILNEYAVDDHAEGGTYYAIIAGHYYLVAAKGTDLDWKGPPDKSLYLYAATTSPKGLTVYMKWNVSGVEQQDAFGGACAFATMGQYFEHVTVTSSDDDNTMTLAISEGGKEIFHSPPLRGKGTIEYTKP